MSEALERTLYGKPGHLIRRCQQIAVALFLERLAPLALTPIQYAVLVAVETEPGVEQARLARLVALDRTSASRVADGLEARGLLRREADPGDRRLRRLRLTEAGQALRATAEAEVEAVQDAILAPLSPVERDGFLAGLRRLAEAHNESSRAPLLARAAE